MKSKVIVVAGFSEDLTEALGERHGEDVYLINEESCDPRGVPKADVVAYLFSRDTAYSSQLLSWFTWVHHQAEPAEEVVVPLGDVDLGRAIFDFAKTLPRITLVEFQRRLDAEWR